MHGEQPARKGSERRGGGGSPRIIRQKEPTPVRATDPRHKRAPPLYAGRGFVGNARPPSGGQAPTAAATPHKKTGTTPATDATHAIDTHTLEAALPMQ